MKKTQLYEVFANIRATFVSFFSIMMFVALGVAVFLGLHWSAMALQTAMEHSFEQANFSDIEITVPRLLTEGQIDELSRVEGVELMETGFATTCQFKVGKETTRAKVQSIAPTLSQPVVVEGSLPTESDQIAVMAHWAHNNNVNVGDRLSIADGSDPDLSQESYTVCALVESPSYLAKSPSTYGVSMGGPISCVMFVTEEGLGDALSFDSSVCLYVRCKGTAGLSPFSEDYRKNVAPISDRLSKRVGTDLTEQLTALYDLFDESRTKLSKALKDPKNLKGLNKEEKQAVRQLQGVIDESGNMTFTIMGQQVTIDEAPQRIQNLKDLFDKGGAQAFVSDRSHNGGIMFAQMLIDILERLRFSMAALFVVVGLLVCYSAISRMVHEQIVQVGTKKALGLFVGEVTMGYLVYAAVAVTIGVLAGAAAAVLVVQAILNPPLANCFVLGTYPSYASAPQALGIGGVELTLILAATWLSCHGMLKRRTIELLAGTKPPTAKPHFFETWKIWQRMPLLGKTVVNNCLNDKRRVVGTLMGVAGCTALVVCALTLNNNVLGSFNQQYAKVYAFDAIANLDTSYKKAQESVQKAFEKKSMPTAPVLVRTVALGTTGDERASMPARMFVPTNDERFFERYHARTTSGGEVDLSQNGVWVAAGFGHSSGLKEGDSVRIIDMAGEIHELPILGFYTHYLVTPDVIMGSKAFEKTYAFKPTANALLVDSGSADIVSLANELARTPGLNGISNDKYLSQRAFNQFAKISRTVVLVYVGLAALMAIVVLLNLDLMFIQEKKRELIVLMICGFSVRDAKRYVSCDMVFLTLVGILLGIALGAAAGFVSVRSVEPTNVMFVHSINARACLMGAGISGAFALVMGLIALRRIPRFKLTDINRF